MKKVLFSLVAMSLLATTIISCQSNQKGTTESSTDTAAIASKVDTAASATTTTTTATTAKTNRVKSILDVSPTIKLKTPTFTNEDVNSSFEQFEPIKQAYIAAINSKDPAKIKEVTTKYGEWVKVASSYGSKLTKDENQIYIDHYTQLVSQWDQLTLKIKK